MNIAEFKQVLLSFAQEPSDVDVSQGRVVANFRDEVIDATISFASDGNRGLIVEENGERTPARSWITTRIARVPQLADRIVATFGSAASPFVNPSAMYSSNVTSTDDDVEERDDAVAVLCDLAGTQVPGATSVVYLTSDAGEGKTTVIAKAAERQARRYKSKEASSLIVPIPLSGRAFLTFDDAVIAALVNKLRFNYLYYDSFMHLVRMGVLVPAFDGYEEMLVEGSKGEAVSALGNLVQGLDSSGAVVIAARKAFFEYLSLRTQAKLLDAIGDRSAVFAKVELNRWTKEQFVEYGRLRKVEDADAVYETVCARLGANHPLLTRAVLVRRLFDVAANVREREELAALLGANPHDYFFTFVDAIVRREAEEKWLARVTGDVMEPLLEKSEHHALLAAIAAEMWHSSTNSLRYDVLDLVVELFCEGRRKPAGVIRQVKERVKQHSLLAADSSKGLGVSFDHEDFQNFYLGEALGHLLVGDSKAELQGFLSAGLLPDSTIEQAIQFIERNAGDASAVLIALRKIDASEASFTFCKDNCGALAIRLAEIVGRKGESVALRGMFFRLGALSGRDLAGTDFNSCHFQPTSFSGSHFTDVRFEGCDFERIELRNASSLVSCQFVECRVESLVDETEVQVFEPASIWRELVTRGALTSESAQSELSFDVQDERMKALERFLRSFMRSTHVDDTFIRLRVGRAHASLFFDDILPELLARKVIEEVPWKGQGVQHRYKLVIPMSDVSRAFEQSRGDFDAFLHRVTG